MTKDMQLMPIKSHYNLVMYQHKVLKPVFAKPWNGMLKTSHGGVSYQKKSILRDRSKIISHNLSAKAPKILGILQTKCELIFEPTLYNIEFDLTFFH